VQWLFALQRQGLLPNDIEFLVNLDDHVVGLVPFVCMGQLPSQVPILSYSAGTQPLNIPFLPMHMDLVTAPPRYRAWKDKAPILFWRGTLTNVARENVVHQTLQLADVDARLTHVMKELVPNQQHNASYYHGRGLMAEYSEAEHVASHKYLLDVDGRGWSSRLKGLLEYGSVILKVATDHQEFFYPLLVHRQNIIIINADLSNLADELAWLRAHDAEAAAIAQAGVALSRVINFELAMAYATNLLTTLKWKLAAKPRVDNRFVRVYDVWNQPLLLPWACPWT